MSAEEDGSEREPMRRVIGLAHDGQGLPRVVLKAAGPVAQEVLSHSLYVNGPRVVRDGELLARLARLPVDACIDPSLFQVVAALLAHVLAMNEQLRNAGQGHAGTTAPTAGQGEGLPWTHISLTAPR